MTLQEAPNNQAGFETLGRDVSETCCGSELCGWGRLVELIGVPDLLGEVAV